MNIEKTFCINLDHRTQRWNSVQPEFEKLGIVPRRFPAIKNFQGYIGCMLSHLAVLEQAKDLNCFMVTEDDIRVIGDDSINVLKAAMDQLPEDWDMLYLGANPQKTLVRYSANLFTLKNAWCTHAMIFNNNKNKQSSVVKFILENTDIIYELKKIDIFYSDVVQEMYKVFIVNPLIATQSNAYSDVTKKYNLYFDLIKDGYEKHTK